jgi:hypothetical protein
VNALRDDEARSRRAPLSGREVRALQADVDRDIEVGVVEDDLRVLAAHLELHFLHRLDRGLRDAGAGRHRAREADRVDVAPADDGITDEPSRGP